MPAQGQISEALKKRVAAATAAAAVQAAPNNTNMGKTNGFAQRRHLEEYVRDVKRLKVILVHIYKINKRTMSVSVLMAQQLDCQNCSTFYKSLSPSDFNLAFYSCYCPYFCS